MCIFCGGSCGGVGDTLLPFVGAGISAAVIQLRGRRARKRSADNPELPADFIEPTEDAPDETPSKS